MAVRKVQNRLREYWQELYSNMVAAPAMATANDAPSPASETCASDLAQKDEEPKDYNIWLDSVGLVQTNISLFELLEVDKEEAAKLRTLKGNTPMKLVMQATTRSVFRDAVEGGKWRVDPRLPGVLADAITAYNAWVEETRSRIEKTFRLSETEPAPWPLEASLWLFQDALYEVQDDYPEEEKKLLVQDFADREKKRIERLKVRFGSAGKVESKNLRPRIPEEVRVAVWRRDEGRCVRCDSRDALEYDHIIPISKGGSNTVRNIELLCEKCNREKGDRIE